MCRTAILRIDVYPKITCGHPLDQDGWVLSPLWLCRCTVLTLSEARWSWNDPNFLVPGRVQLEANGKTTLFISCAADIASPGLKLTACPFALLNQTGAPREHGWGIARGDWPSEPAIYQWMEQQIVAESAKGFEAEMDRLLWKFVRQPPTGVQAKWHDLLSDLLKMRCMWKIWSCKQLFFRPNLRTQGTAFNARVSSIQDSLRSFAAQAISQHERKILEGIQLLVVDKKDKVKKDTDEVTIVKWLLLWQMMLLYRQSLSWMLAQEQPFSLAGQSIVSNAQLLAR